MALKCKSHLANIPLNTKEQTVFKCFISYLSRVSCLDYIIFIQLIIRYMYAKFGRRKLEFVRRPLIHSNVID